MAPYPDRLQTEAAFRAHQRVSDVVHGARRDASEDARSALPASELPDADAGKSACRAPAFLLEPGSHRLAQAVLLLILIAAAMAAYGLLLAALGATGWREVVNAIKRPGDLRA